MFAELQKIAPIDHLIPRCELEKSTIISVEVPGYTDFQFSQASVQHSDDIGRKFETLWQDATIARYADETNCRFSLVNKKVPHAVLDVMLMQSSDSVKSTLSLFENLEIDLVKSIAENFLRLLVDCSSEDKFDLGDCVYHVVYNADPNTVDRENGMGYSKRFHLHLNVWPTSFFTNIETVSVGSINATIDRRRLVDPLTPLAGKLVHQLINREGLLQGWRYAVPCSDGDCSSDKNPPGAVFELVSNSLKDLGSAFWNDLAKLDHSMQREYRIIRKAASQENLKLMRPNLFDSKQLEKNLRNIGYSAASSDDLVRLINCLGNLSPEMYTYLVERKHLRVRHLAMNGLNYSVGLFGRIKKGLVKSTKLCVQSKLLSDTGGAGIIYNDIAPIIRLRRNSRPFSISEHENRLSFQELFVQKICKADNRWHANTP